jgi:hypothetical protein
VGITHGLWMAGLAAVVLSVPFGYWRAGVPKFTAPWFVAVHGSVPLVIGVRLLMGLSWQLATVPLLVGAVCTGQFLGGCLRGRSKTQS